MKNQKITITVSSVALKLFCFLVLLMTQFGFGQKTANIPKKISQKEIDKLSNMSESELENYREKLLKKYIKQVEKVMDEHPELMSNVTLPNSPVVLPPKDLYLLKLGESLSTEKRDILASIAKFKVIIAKDIAKEVIEEIDKIYTQTDAVTISNNAVSLWYGNRREAGLYMSALSVEKDPANILLWNNLGALLNLSGIHTLAIPIIRHTLDKTPKSSMAINNLGQAYLGLGDIDKAEKYFKECLLLDPLNPEANHAMSFICIAKNKKDESLLYFRKEFQLAFRDSSWSLIESQNLEDQINFSEIMNQGDFRGFTIDNKNSISFVDKESQILKGPNANFFHTDRSLTNNETSTFSELHLTKFVLPVFPKNSDEAILFVKDFITEFENCKAEKEFWYTRIAPDLATREMMAQKVMLHGNWADKATNYLLKNEMPFLHFVNEEYTTLVHDAFAKKNQKLQMVDEKRKKDQYWDYCPTVKEIEDEYIGAISGYLEGRHVVLQSQWKVYIDRLGYIASLDPTYASVVYRATADYMDYLGHLSGEIINLYPNYYSCFPPAPKNSGDGLESNRLYEIFCKRGIGGSLPFGIAKVHINCERLELGASLEFIKFGYEKKFAAGTSTVWVGAGVDGGMDGIMKIEANQKLFMVFDKNNTFTDAGVSGGMKITIEQVMNGGFDYSMGVNSGFNSGYKSEYTFVKNVNKAMGFMP